MSQTKAGQVGSKDPSICQQSEKVGKKENSQEKNIHHSDSKLMRMWASVYNLLNTLLASVFFMSCASLMVEEVIIDVFPGYQVIVERPRAFM